MSYQSDDHEGWASAEFPGGLFSTGGDAEGVLARRFTDAEARAWKGIGRIAYELEDEVRVDAALAIGWRGLCYCGWRGPLWARVAGPEAHDLSQRRVYAETGRWADPPAEVDDAIRAEWLEHLPSPAIADLRARWADLRTAEAAVDVAVARARADGSSWDDIGEATGMRRQSAHARWAKRLPPMPGTGAGAGERILIQMPGTGVAVDYADQRERDCSVRLAQSRQRIAERTGYIPAWTDLSEEDRESAALEARNWLRAAAEAGLLLGRESTDAPIPGTGPAENGGAS